MSIEQKPNTTIQLPAELMSLFQESQEENRAKKEAKFAYSLLVCYILFKDQDFSVDGYRDRAEKIVEGLVKAYQNLPESLDVLDQENKEKALFIKKVIGKIEDFFAKFNNRPLSKVS